MGNFDNGVFELLKNKMDNTMKEELNKLKFLAGLLSEAPISWDSEPEDDEEDFKPGFTQDNMVNQLGKIADSDEASKDAEAMKVKKFKVADTVITDDGKKFKLSGSEARALIKMFNMLSSQRAGEEESPREKFNRSIQQSKGLQNMLDFAKAKGLVEETSAMPQLDLSDIKGEYGVEEGSGEEHFCQACNGSGCEKCDDTGVAKEYQDESFNDNNVEEGFDPEEFEGEFDWEGVGDDGETSPCTVSYVAKVDEMGRPVVDPKSIRIDCQQDGNSKLGFDPDFDLQMQDMNELLQACQEDADEMWDSRDNKYAHGESIEEDEEDSWKGSTKDGHKYKAVADDMDGSQYLKVFYGDGKYFRIYYDSNVGRYAPDQVAPETNDPRAEKVFADLPDDFFDKYGSEGETGLEDIIDMIKSVDESLEEAMCGCCGNDPCDCAPDCEGCKGMDESVHILDKALEDLKKLAGI